MTKILRELKHLVMLPLCALFFFIGAVTVQATTYYVATTGSDSNSGTSGSPFLTIQRCIDTVAAGDTCTVADGTYTDTDGNGIVGYITGANGTAGAPITIKSTNPFGAIIKVPGINSHNAGFYVARTYYIIEGFNISGGTSNDASASHHGVSVAGGATGSIVRKNTIHNIASTICSNSIFGPFPSRLICRSSSAGLRSIPPTSFFTGEEAGVPVTVAVADCCCATKFLANFTKSS